MLYAPYKPHLTTTNPKYAVLMQEQTFPSRQDILPSPSFPDVASLPSLSPCTGSPSQTTFLSTSYDEKDRTVSFLTEQIRARLQQEKQESNISSKKLASSLSARDLDKICRTIYITDLDKQITEEQLKALFVTCGPIVECRICGNPKNATRFAFIEYFNEADAFQALSYTGTILGLYPIRISPSKTPILPLNNELLPKSEQEREAVARTVYIANIHQTVEHAVLKAFFQTTCGDISKIRLLGDKQHETKIAFVEFFTVDSATRAIGLSGTMLGPLPIRVTPSKTPVKTDAGRRSLGRMSTGSTRLSASSTAMIATPPLSSSPSLLSKLSTGANTDFDYDHQYQYHVPLVVGSSSSALASTPYESFATSNAATASTVATLANAADSSVDMDAIQLAAAFAAAHGVSHPDLPQLLVEILKKKGQN